MKRLFLLAAVFAVEATTMPSQAQKPMPAWLLSEAYMKQLGIAERTNEKFDFTRFPQPRTIAAYWELRDTVQHPEKRHLMSARIFEAGEPLTTLRWQLSSEVVRMDTVTNLYAFNDALECTLCHHAAPGITDVEAARLRDSMARIPTLQALECDLVPDALAMSILPAEQSGAAYALQYLLARAGIDASPILTYRTTFWREDLPLLLDRVLRPGKPLRIGSDIERFARKARFSEGCIYVLSQPGHTPPRVWFFFANGRFWMKFGICQYVSLPSIVDVWRHGKEATRIVPYTLDPRFEE